MWLLNSAGRAADRAARRSAPSPRIYHVDGTGDLNGDGRNDIIFRDPTGTWSNG